MTGTIGQPCIVSMAGGDSHVLTVHLPESFRLQGAKVICENAELAEQKETATVRIVPSATETVDWKLTFAE